MSCIRCSRLLHKPLLKAVTVRTVASTSGSGGDSDDGEKTKSVSGLMTALKGLKVDGALSKPKIGFSAAGEFRRRKLQKSVKTTPEGMTPPHEASEEDDKIQQATQEVAKIFPDQKKTHSELLEQLMRVKTSPEDPENISDVLTGIKVKRGTQSKSAEGAVTDHGHGDRQSHVSFNAAFGDGGLTRQRPDDLGDGQLQPRQHQRRRTLFDHPRLNIFKPLPETPGDVEIMSEQTQSIWEREAEREKKELLAETVRNGFEEMIEMTREGKLWTYPIDNEKGLEEEQKVPFYEHIFLEDHLEGFPNIPEVMNFMELVLIGLSKNPYLTVEQKRDHIDWFRDYFSSKLEVLKESISAATS